MTRVLDVSDISEGETGLVSGLINTTQQIGGALGLAVMWLLLSHAERFF